MPTESVVMEFKFPTLRQLNAELKEAIALRDQLVRGGGSSGGASAGRAGLGAPGGRGAAASLSATGMAGPQRAPSGVGPVNFTAELERRAAQRLANERRAADSLRATSIPPAPPPPPRRPPGPPSGMGGPPIGPSASAGRPQAPGFGGALDAANRAAFGPGIFALSVGFGGMPLQALDRAAATAARSFTPADSARSAIDLERQTRLADLGRQGEPTRRFLDDLGNKALGAAERAGLGGVVTAASAGTQAIAAGANVASAAVAIGSLVATMRGQIPATVANTAATERNTAALAGRGGVGGGGAPTGPTAAGGRGRFGLPPLNPLLGALAVGGIIDQLNPDLGPQATAKFNDLLKSGPAARRALEEAGRTTVGRLVPPAFDPALRPGAGGGGTRGFGPGPVTEASEAALGQALAQPRIDAARAAPGFAAFDRARIGEARIAEVAPDVAAFQSAQLQRAQAALGQAQGQRAIRENAADELRARIRLGEAQAFDRDRLDIQTRRQGDEIHEAAGRRNRDIGEGLGRSLRDIGTRRADQSADIALSRARGLADIDRGLARSVRDIDFSAAESREDIERQAKRGTRDLLLGQIGGLGGALVRNAVARRDALADLDLQAGRAKGAATRGAADARADLTVGTSRAEQDANTAAIRAERDARQSAADAFSANATATGDALGALAKSSTQAKDDLDALHGRQKAQFAEEAALAAERRSQARADLEAQARIVDAQLQGTEAAIRATDEFARTLRGAAGLRPGDDAGNGLGETADGLAGLRGRRIAGRAPGNAGPDGTGTGDLSAYSATDSAAGWAPIAIRGEGRMQATASAGVDEATLGLHIAQLTRAMQAEIATRGSHLAELQRVTGDEVRVRADLNGGLKEFEGAVRQLKPAIQRAVADALSM